MSFSALLLLSLAGPAPAASAVVDVAEVKSILVLRLKSGPELSQPGGPVEGLTEIIATELSSRAGLRVVTEAELEQIVKLESTRQAAGCDTTACVAELAGAIGAELALFGSLSALGDTYVVGLNLYSQNQARSVARTTVEGALGEMPAKIRAALAELVGVEMARTPTETEAPVERAASAMQPWYIGGGTALAVGATVALVGLLPLTSPEESAQLKEAAFWGGWAGIVVAVAGGATVATAFALEER